MWDRWIARGAAALLLAGAGHGMAQNSPPASTAPAALAQPRTTPAPAPAQAEAPILVMRTAGQPDRQLKVIKQSNPAEGEPIAEVQDVSTGQIFTLPGKVVAMLPRAANTVPPPTLASLIPAPQVRPLVPVLEPKSPTAHTAPKVTFIPPPMGEPAPAPAAVADPRPTPAVAPASLPPGAPHAWRPLPTDDLAPAPTTPPAVESGKPDRWQPTKRMNPSALRSFSEGTQTIARGTHHSGHDDAPPKAPAAVRYLRPRVFEERGELVPVAYRTVETQIRDETQSYVYELATALRPSIRENAALCLAEGRYGWRREVKTVLAKAAIADPAPSVRAKCIELLMHLGYHDPEYMAYLQAATTPGGSPTMVRAAAKEALAKLAPRGN